jgi:hypothetical protein
MEVTSRVVSFGGRSGKQLPFHSLQEDLNKVRVGIKLALQLTGNGVYVMNYVVQHFKRRLVFQLGRESLYRTNLGQTQTMKV